jgi:hypothetical protein
VQHLEQNSSTVNRWTSEGVASGDMDLKNIAGQVLSGQISAVDNMEKENEGMLLAEQTELIAQSRANVERDHTMGSMMSNMKM